MPRAGISPIRLAPVLAVLLGASCFSLPKVDVIRVIDDFAEDGGVTQPTWNAFGPWSCGPFVDLGQASDAGQDGGLDAGIDAGQFVKCTLGIGTGDDMDPPPFPGAITHALVASFNFATQYNVEVLTQTTPPGQVNLTGFSQLRFNAKLLSTTPGTSSALPPGTELHVELRCASPNKPLVHQNVPLTAEVVTWKPILLSLSDFTGGSQRQTCLATVDGIGFIVVPGAAQPGTQSAGTLQLDNIRLQ